MKIIRGLTDATIHFGVEGGAEIQIPNFNKGLIYKQSKARVWYTFLWLSNVTKEIYGLILLTRNFWN